VNGWLQAVVEQIQEGTWEVYLPKLLHECCGLHCLLWKVSQIVLTHLPLLKHALQVWIPISSCPTSAAVAGMG
jgi:hypothetical protein